ncbi:helix-turn-helix domain-containing protein [Candidatus Venteria ishoeyi]|uniref:HTH cro/C1-type domain-containing protein n=1 Tax=Candidatus Venteria ishoeyi TaxID=1899563 RepID=A0A1H6F2Z1_9GAMM|nr:transcriptional regulator [Candidatus Venteria ishoeyi]MDM8547585.1 transcriptional regulator [Candidatus Venteria ishoeyi]SEH04527.1 Uncharacterised protein [Candidatus Venteria ishoeyi]
MEKKTSQVAEVIKFSLLRTDDELNAALAEMERLWGSAPNTPDGDRLEVIALLVENYESKHYSITPPDPVEAIKFRMDQAGLTRKDLEPYIGSKGRVSEVLNHKRSLSLKMIRNLHNGLHIPLESLITV